MSQSWRPAASAVLIVTGVVMAPDDRAAQDRGLYPYYGGASSTQGDPLVQELSREPSLR